MSQSKSKSAGARWFHVEPSVRLGAPDLSGDSILFHGVNKSGSWAMAELLRDGYRHADREDEFMCRYLGMPKGRDEAVARFSASLTNPQILIDHDLVGQVSRFPSASYITLLRDPVRRLVSCYYWMRERHPEFIRGRDLMTWAREAGHAYSLVFQFACFGAPNDEHKRKISKLPVTDIAALGRQWFDEHVKAFGITELFEESAHWLSSSLGLKEIAPWAPDKRNVTRPKWSKLSPDLLADLKEIIAYDIDFYGDKRSEFERLVSPLRGSDGFKEYVATCTELRAEQEAYGAVVTEGESGNWPAAVAELEARALGFGRKLTKQLKHAAPKLLLEGLPEWWNAGNNRLYVNPATFSGAVPKLSVPATKKPPTNAILVMLSANMPPLTIWGDAATVVVESDVTLPQSSLVCGDLSLVYIGQRVRTTVSAKIDARNGGCVWIEGDCLLGGGCRLTTDDSHAILEAETGRRINPYGGRIIVEEHVWLGVEVILSGGTHIGSDSVIGARCIVDCPVGNGALVKGNPAVVVRQGINWSQRDLPASDAAASATETSLIASQAGIIGS